MTDEVSKLKQELQEALASFDDLSSSSAAVEKELNDEVEGLSKANAQLKQELAEQKEKFAEISKRLAEMTSQTERISAELRTEQAALTDAKSAIVALETKNTQLDNDLRASQALAERTQAKFDEHLEQAAVEKCQLEDVKKVQKRRRKKNDFF